MRHQDRSSIGLDAFKHIKLSMLGSVPAVFTCLSTLLIFAVINRYLASLTMSARWPCFAPHCDVLTALAATAAWSSRMPYVMNLGSPKSLSIGLFHSFCSTNSVTISMLRSVDILGPFLKCCCFDILVLEVLTSDF